MTADRLLFIEAPDVGGSPDSKLFVGSPPTIFPATGDASLLGVGVTCYDDWFNVRKRVHKMTGIIRADTTYQVFAGSDFAGRVKPAKGQDFVKTGTVEVWLQSVNGEGGEKYSSVVSATFDSTYDDWAFTIPASETASLLETTGDYTSDLKDTSLWLMAKVSDTNRISNWVLSATKSLESV
jgi:hypothetical protein